MSERQHLLEFCDAQIDRVRDRVSRVRALANAGSTRARERWRDVVDALGRELERLEHQREHIADADETELARLRGAFEATLELLTNDVEKALAGLSNPDAPASDDDA